MAAKFWVLGTGALDGVDTTHISDSSGGAGGAVYPAAGDTLTFDGSSGGGTVTMTAGVTVTSITMGAFTGTLDTNGQTVTLSSTFSVTGTATRTLTLGSSTINCTTMVLTSTTNLTFNAGTSTINAAASSITFGTGVGLAFANVTISPTANATINGSNTFSSLTLTGPASKACYFSLAGNQTVAGTFTANGNSATDRIVINSTAKGTTRTITAATVTITNADFQDITGAGAGSWDLSAITGGSGDCGGNNSITFTTGATQYWYTATTGAKTWSTAGNWYLGSGGTGGAGRVPLPQDSARFDSSSIGAAGTTITQDMPRIPGADWTGVTNTPTWTTSTTASFFGSITLVSGMTLTASASAYTYEGRASSTLTSAGKTWSKALLFNAPGGTMNLGDALTISGAAVDLRNGTFDTGGFNVTAKNWDTSSGTPSGRTNNLNGSLITLTGDVAGWSAATTNTSVNAGTSTIRLSGALISDQTFAGAGFTYYNLENATTGAFALRFTGSNTFNNFHIDASAAARTVLFTAGTTTTVASMTRDAGTNVITLGSITAASHALAKSGGGTITMDYMSISRSTATPSSTWTANLSTDGGNNSGWTFTNIYTLALDAGSYSITGQDVSLDRGFSLDLDPGTYTITGQDISFLIEAFLALDAGSYTITGQDVTFTVGRSTIVATLTEFAKPGASTPAFATPGTPSVSLEKPGTSSPSWEIN